MSTVKNKTEKMDDPPTATTPTSAPVNESDFSLPPRDPEEFDELVLKFRNGIVRLNDLKDPKEGIEMRKLLQELNNNLEVCKRNYKL